MHQHINEVFELVRNAEIPHRERKQILVSRLEVIGDADNRTPRLDLLGRLRLPVLDRVGGGKCGTVELRQISLPKVERLDDIARVRGAIDFEEVLRHGDGG